MKLVQPSKEMKKHFINMALDYKVADDSRYQIAFEKDFDFQQYLQKLERESIKENVKTGYVPTTTMWLIDDFGKICGVSRLRHYLVPHLEMEGGNIGYDVPPSERMKGNGSYLLSLTLVKARALGLKEVLVTCDSDNTGSAKIITKNGGIFENEVISEESGKMVSRYWIKFDDI